jgi:hypothetical protein
MRHRTAIDARHASRHEARMMKSQFADDVLERHRELCAAARRADALGARYLEALEAGDALGAGTGQVNYREQLREIARALEALDALLVRGSAAPSLPAPAAYETGSFAT